MEYPRTVEEIAADYNQRRAGILKALTEEVDDFYPLCDPSKDNLCLYGTRDGLWTVDLPVEEVPAELPEPCLGINFARDGMNKKDWLALVAVHSDAWLMAVAFFYGVKLDAAGRLKLFKLINHQQTLFEIVRQKKSAGPPAAKRVKFNPQGRPSESKTPTGVPIAEGDLTPELRGRMGELFWPDDGTWYLMQIQTYDPETRQAKILYATGEEEDLDMNEILNDSHMCMFAA